MRLTAYTDYALRVLMYLGLAEGRLSTIQEIAEAYGISKNHLMKIVQELRRAGYVEAVRGRGGGLRLGRPADEISVGAVIRLGEEDFRLVECFDPATNRCPIAGPCALQGLLGRALGAYFEVLDQSTLADLLGKKSRLERALMGPTGSPGARGMR